MDFQPFDGKSDDGAEMVVMDPGTGDPTDAVIVLAGMDSKVWRGAAKKLNRLALRSVDPRKQSKELERVVDEVDKHKEDLLAAVTIRWRNVQLNGEKLSCTRDNAAMMYKKFPWLLEQVNVFVGDRANFFRSVAGPADGRNEGQDAAATAPAR